MKLKLTQPGYETYTGQLGMSTFTNGLSDNELSVEECAGIANIFTCDQIVATVDLGEPSIDTDTVVTSDTAEDLNADTSTDIETAPAPIDPTAEATPA